MTRTQAAEGVEEEEGEEEQEKERELEERDRRRGKGRRTSHLFSVLLLCSRSQSSSSSLVNVGQGHYVFTKSAVVTDDSLVLRASCLCCLGLPVSYLCHCGVV